MAIKMRMMVKLMHALKLIPTLIFTLRTPPLSLSGVHVGKDPHGMKFALTAIYPSEQFRSKHLFPVYIVYFDCETNSCCIFFQL